MVCIKTYCWWQPEIRREKPVEGTVVYPILYDGKTWHPETGGWWPDLFIFVVCQSPGLKGALERAGALVLLKIGVEGDVVGECFYRILANFCVDFNWGHLLRVLVELFPERRFVAGFFRRLLAYLTPHISHTYPAHFTYPTHIHFKRIHHTYPTHIQHIAHIPHISIPNVSHTYVSHQYVSMQCVSIQKVVIRIPPITTNIPYISSTSYISHTYPFQTYPFQTYPTNTCPLQTYPFKRCASAGIANVSHQYISHQYVSSTRIPPVRIHSMRIHSKVCISRNGFEYEHHCISFHTIHTIVTRREW